MPALARVIGSRLCISFQFGRASAPRCPQRSQRSTDLVMRYTTKPSLQRNVPNQKNYGRENISLREAVSPEATPVIFAAGLEVIVQTDARNVVFGAPGEGYPEQRDGRAASVDVEIFNLGAPIRRKHPFDAGTGCPTGL